MAQLQTLPHSPETFHTGMNYVSLHDMINLVSGYDKPVTLREITASGYYEVSTVRTALQEHIRRGELASFKIGPLSYYTSTRNVFTVKGPSLPNVALEFVKNALWQGKRRVNSLSDKEL
jgi:hypothetical protein